VAMFLLSALEKELNACRDPKKGAFLQRFFKTGKGEYGEGDIFFGFSVPQARLFAKKYRALSFSDIKKLLKSPVHEKRLIGLLILVHNFEKGSEDDKKRIFDFYMASLQYINNWDLVDLSAPKIAGAYLFKKDCKILYNLARSKNLYKKRPV